MSSAPTAIFLDTSIFDGQQYNFESRKFIDFVKLCKQMHLELLLPHPTELEIRRHIKERADFAIKAIRDAVAQAPFLRKWKGFPDDKFIADVRGTRAMLGTAAGNEYRRFLKNFNVIHLDYTGIDVASIMTDYDRCHPPFAEGDKRKEFPDAFAIAILAHYAKTNTKNIAVVSNDGDFAKGCRDHARLLYFKNLEEVTASLLRDSDPDRVLRFSLAIEAAYTEFARQFEDPLRWTLVYLHNHGFLVESSTTDEVELKGFNVIAIGKDECTIAFSAVVESEHTVSWIDPHNPSSRLVGTIAEPSSVHGTAKVSFTSSARKIGKKTDWELHYKSVSAIEFDNFGVVGVATYPSNYEPPQPLGLLGMLQQPIKFYGGGEAVGMLNNPYFDTLKDTQDKND